MEKHKRNVYNIPPRSLAMKILSLSFLIATILFSLAFNCSEQKNDQPKNNAQEQPGQNPNAAGQETGRKKVIR